MAKVGRPTKMTEETIKKLEEVYAIGGSDSEACFFANISHQTLYSYQLKNPEFVERKESLKNNPILKARRAVVNSLDKPHYAFEYLKRKKRDEFGDVVQHEGDIRIQIDTQIAQKHELTQGTIIDSEEPKQIQGDKLREEVWEDNASS